MLLPRPRLRIASYLAPWNAVWLSRWRRARACSYGSRGVRVIVVLLKIALVLFIAWQIDRMIWHDPLHWS